MESQNCKGSMIRGVRFLISRKAEGDTFLAMRRKTASQRHPVVDEVGDASVGGIMETIPRYITRRETAIDGVKKTVDVSVNNLVNQTHLLTNAKDHLRGAEETDRHETDRLRGAEETDHHEIGHHEIGHHEIGHHEIGHHETDRGEIDGMITNQAGYEEKGRVAVMDTVEAWGKMQNHIDLPMTIDRDRDHHFTQDLLIVT